MHGATIKIVSAQLSIIKDYICAFVAVLLK